MNRNLTSLVIGGLAVVAIILGYLYYQERQKTTGIEVSVGNGSISVDKK